jgi:transposase InsO family protein
VFNHAGADALRRIDKAYPELRAKLNKRLVTQPAVPDCAACHTGRQTRAPFPAKLVTTPATPPIAALDVATTGTVGPLPGSLVPQAAYLKLLRDRATTLLAGLPVAARTSVPAAIQTTLSSWQNTRNAITKRLHSDNAKELVSAALRNFLRKQGTTATTTSPHSSPQNGESERAIRTVLTHARTNLHAAGLPATIWPFAVHDTIVKLNATPRKVIENGIAPKSPYELSHGSKAPTTHLLPFGKLGYVTDTGQKTNFAPRAHQARYHGATNASQYNSLVGASKISLCRPTEFTPIFTAAQAMIKPPSNLGGTQKRPLAERLLWNAAYDAEMDRNENLGLWTYETLQPDDTPRTSLVKFSIKLNSTGQPIGRKVRFAIRGDLMKPGSEFNPAQTSSQTPSHTTFRLFIALGAAQDLPINFLDVPGAYPRAHADPACRQAMLQPPRSNGQLKHPDNLCVM